MARTLSSQAVFHQLTGVFRLDDDTSGGTVDAIAAKFDTTFDVGTGEGSAFTAGDYIRIGANGSGAEVNQVDSIATDQITVKVPLSRALAAGEDVMILQMEDLGATDENGVNIDTTQGETEIIAGTQKLTYLTLSQNVVETLTFALRDFDRENLAASLGMDDSDSRVGTKGVALPMITDVITESYKPWVFEGLLEGGSTVAGIIMSGKIASANQTMQFVEGAATIIPFTIKSNGNRSFVIE